MGLVRRILRKKVRMALRRIGSWWRRGGSGQRERCNLVGDMAEGNRLKWNNGWDWAVDSGPRERSRDWRRRFIISSNSNMT